MMHIKNHLLYIDRSTQAEFISIPSRNRSSNKITPKFLVIHYTFAPSKESTINWFRNPQASVSAHLLIGRDGTITQFVPFNQTAYHAGDSFWYGLDRLNNHSIGIELENSGLLNQNSEGRWVPYYRRNIREDEIIIARHKHQNEKVGWHNYTDEQLDSAIKVGALLKEKYNLNGVVGHDDISPSRKIDPGPAFPMGSFRSKVMGRGNDNPEIFKTTTALNIRLGPGSNHAALPESPLPANTKVEIIDENQPSWRLVDVLDPINGSSGLQGWVHGRYLVESQ